MKKIITLILLVLGASALALAVPALPGKYKYRQPDGTVLTLQNHGDEYYHWTTDQFGRVVKKGSDGFFHVTEMPKPDNRRRNIARNSGNGPSRIWSSHDNPFPTNFGDRKVLCILANFTDSTFVIDNPRESFYNMLNQEGYDNNGAIGSVRDYYIDNSHGQFRPSFDVFGPVTVSESSAYYDQNGAHLAIIEAYEQMQDQINIEDYDTDDDGCIDMVLFYYPGHNQAEGAGEESIWPHQSTGDFGFLGNKRLVRYFCTSELKWDKGTIMCGIGTTCHEFAHSLGLPDTYDTDYGENGYNEFTTNNFDLMAGGNYNDQSRRPPYLNALELNMLGWMDAPEELVAGNYSLTPVRNYTGYVTGTQTEGEYFILECRDNYKWDSGIGQYGLLVYHVDQSNRIVVDSYSASYLWNNTNAFNRYGGHPCFYLLSPAEKEHTYPGQSSTTDLILTDWEDSPTGVMLKDIAFDGSKSSFTANFSTGRKLIGKVFKVGGQALEGAQVVVSQSEYPFAAAPALLQNDLVAYTDAEGYYEISLPDKASNYQILTVRMDGYVPQSVNVPASKAFINNNFYLYQFGEGVEATLHRFDPYGDTIWNLSFGISSFAVGFYYPADELASLGAIGSTITSVIFHSNADVYDKAYIIIEISGERALLRDVTDQYTPNTFVTVDISDAGLKIKENDELIVGYGLTGLPTSNCYPFKAQITESPNNGNRANPDFLNSSQWGKATVGDSYPAFFVAADLSLKAEIELNHLSVAFINVENDVPEVIAPSSKTVYSTEWYLDGNKVDAPAALSTAATGSHTYMVRLNYYDGTSERVYYDFTRQ